MRPEELIKVAAEVADAARPVSLRWFRQPLDIESKSDESPVTIADRETEAAMRAVLERRVPDHGIYGEEHGQSGLEQRFVWVLDPIDGTRAYITGFPLWGTLIACLDGGKPVLGIIDTPFTGERFSALAGGPALLDGREIRTSNCRRLADARAYLPRHEPMTDAQRAGFERVEAAVRLGRVGYDCYTYALVAAGHIDLIVETGLAPYDYLALVPVIEAAGGRITDWQGRPLGLDSKGDVAAAATPELHAELLTMLAG